jgi:phage shock protein A
VGIFDRIRNRASRVADEVERRNPEAVYEAAVAGRAERMTEHRKVAAGLVAKRNGLQETIESLTREAEQVRVALLGAMEDGDDDTALVLVIRRDEVTAAVAQKTAEMEGLSFQIDQALEAQRALRKSLGDLKKEATTAAVHKAAAEAAIEIHESTSGVSDRASARGLDSVRSSVASLEQRAHKGYLDEEGNSIRGRAAAMGRKAAELDARAQLEALKRQMATDDDD